MYVRTRPFSCPLFSLNIPEIMLAKVFNLYIKVLKLVT